MKLRERLQAKARVNLRRRIRKDYPSLSDMLIKLDLAELEVLVLALHERDKNGKVPSSRRESK